MALTEQTKPYELLVRWDERTGVLRGAHIQFYTSVLRDGQFLSGQPSRAYPVGGAEFPLADVMGTALQDALAAIATLTTERDTARTERDAAQARVAELEAQLAALTTETDENGIPVRVPMAAGRIALSRAGKLAAVKAALAAMPGPAGEEAREWFEYSSHIERRHPTVIAVTPLIGTSADVDALFVAADAIAKSAQP